VVGGGCGLWIERGGERRERVKRELWASAFWLF